MTDEEHIKYLQTELENLNEDIAQKSKTKDRLYNTILKLKIKNHKDYLNYAPIVWEKYDAHPEKNDTIIGYWAEDNSPYYITCPHQLRDLFLKALNEIKEVYN